MRPADYKTFSKWVKEIGLVLFAGLVVQQIVAGSEPNYVVAGVVLSLLTYAVAVWLRLKS